MAQNSTIAVDARTLTFQETGERGIGTYTVEHLSAWAALCPNLTFKLLLEQGTELVRGQRLLSIPNVKLANYTLSQKEFDSVDLFHVPDSMSLIEGYDSPFRMAPPGIKSSVIFYDLIPIALRQSCYDKWHRNLKRAYDARLQHLLDSNAKILAISEATKNDLLKLAKIPAERIDVILAGLSKPPNFTPTQEQILNTRNSLGVNKPFLLVVGGLDEHKGFINTLEASFDLLKSGQMQLVVVGSLIDPWKLQLRDALKNKGINGVIFTGFISDQDLACLYADAIALSFPSEYEGFGFPVLEAMAHGCPVICSNKASLPEVGGDAVLYIQELSPSGVFSAVRQILGSPGVREQLKIKGKERAKLFTWQAVAEKTARAIQL